MDSIRESSRRMIIGEPYSGKLNVRFDEGELEIEPSGHYASSLLYGTSRGALAARGVFYG